MEAVIGLVIAVVLILVCEYGWRPKSVNQHQYSTRELDKPKKPVIRREDYPSPEQYYLADAAWEDSPVTGDGGWTSPGGCWHGVGPHPYAGQPGYEAPYFFLTYYLQADRAVVLESFGAERWNWNQTTLNDYEWTKDGSHYRVEFRPEWAEVISATKDGVSLV